ncbi:hypothetical protein EDB84DRAFT_1437722 [Lactarius hengduanensis]|nr:hypothetical protein EDB84DRAFT_1437722 [Lactarius hengduanensis]
MTWWQWGIMGSGWPVRAREGDDSGVVAVVLHRLEVRWKEKGRKKNLAKSLWSQVGTAAKRKWPMHVLAGAVGWPRLWGEGEDDERDDGGWGIAARPYSTTATIRNVDTFFGATAPVIVISAVLYYLLPTLAPHGHLPVVVCPNTPREYMQAIAPPHRHPATSANASPPATPALRAHELLLPYPLTKFRRSDLDGDEDGNDEDNESNGVKAMVVVGTVTAVIAGTVVQMAAARISTGTAAVTATSDLLGIFAKLETDDQMTTPTATEVNINGFDTASPITIVPPFREHIQWGEEGAGMYGRVGS